jgi:hypothetical protein
MLTWGRSIRREKSSSDMGLVWEKAGVLAIIAE